MERIQTETVPPLWVLKQATLNEGVRCHKQEKKYSTPRSWQPVSAYSNLRNRARGLNVIAPVVHGLSQTATQGNLPFAEYQFWVGQQASYSAIASCRACGEKTYSEKHRRDHMDRTKHTKWLQEAYGHLGANCVICSKPKAKKKWGVPLCEGACVTVWMFGNLELLSLKMALDKAWEKVKDFGIVK